MSEVQNTGQFSKVIVTTAGKEMIAKSQNGQTLTFTRVALGDGLIENSDDPINFTAIKNERLSANIAKYTDRGNGQFELQFRVSNKEVETGFWHREIGVMAKIDEGPEQLYAYTTAGNKASFLYDKTTPIEERIVNIAFVIGNAQNVQVIVNSSIIYVTLEDMEEALDTHNSNIDSHEEAFTKHNDDETAHENLVNMLKEIIENSGINILKRKKSYNVGDIAYSTKITSTTHLASKLYLECIQAGTTGTEEPTLTNIGLNDEITDGAAKFKVYDVGLQSLPVGSIYQSTIATGPEELFGGTWEAMPAGRVLLAQGQSDWGTNYTAGSTGGEATHQLTVGELPTVTPKGAIALNVWANDTVAIVNGGHTFSGSSDRFDYRKPSISGTASFTGKTFGSNQAHNNIQPYISCYIWKRIS
ncbi:phage baseplate protein [uncultured Megamonas sp.]|uniref:phage baseplate protein n=1 Tax=uncultured Megamonas sp. TaxID=286140 RepID=UPI0025978F54|nr:phage tail protein [uncultured Megamonas sp.]